MNQDRLLERIEILWNSYWQKQSVRLFNHSTDMFMDYILSIPYCKLILEKLKDDYSLTDEQYEEYKQKEWSTFVEKKIIYKFFLFCYNGMKRERLKRNIIIRIVNVWDIVKMPLNLIRCKCLKSM